MDQADSNVVIHSPMSEGHSDYEAYYQTCPVLLMAALHNHAFYEFYFHRHGGDMVYINNDTYTMDDCTLMIYPPFQMHGTIIHDKKRPFERAWLHISTDMVRMLSCSLIDFDRLFAMLSEERHLVFHVEPKLHMECMELLHTLSDRGHGTTTADRLQDYSLIMMLLSNITRIANMSGTPATPIPPNSIIRGVVEYINEHFSAPLSLDLLAERFNISKSYLCHKFKETYNCSIYQYVQYQRISKAKELLASGISSTDAAYQCGFSDYSTFLRAFHKLVNDTPTGYKSTMAELPHP